MVATSAAADTTLQVSFCIPEEELHYSLRSNPPWHEAVVMAFQHVTVMLGTTVKLWDDFEGYLNNEDKAIVIQTLLFTSGLNTLLQTLIGTRLPTVMSASTTFIIPVMSIIKDMSKYSFASEHERFVCTMRVIQGALIISSMFNIIIGYSTAWGYFTRFLSPISVIPIICLEGLSKFQSDGFPKLGECIEIGLPMLILLVVFQQYMQFIGGRKIAIFEKFGVLFSVAIVWAFASLLTVSGAYNHVSEQTKLSFRVDHSNLISSSRWVRIPYPFQWGAPIFKASHIFGTMGAAVRKNGSTGIFYAAARFSGATPPTDNVLTRSVGLQGLGMLFDGFFGGVVGTDVSVVVQISTIFMIFFSIFGKFGALFASIPVPMFASIHSILFGIISVTGISYTQYTNNNSPRNLYTSQRNLYTIGLSLFLGLSIPQYFKDATNNGRERVRTTSLWFNNIMKTTFSSAPTVVTAFGTVVDNTLDTKNTENERGLPSWRKFQKSDPEGFYKFPPPLGPRRRPPTLPEKKKKGTSKDFESTPSEKQTGTSEDEDIFSVKPAVRETCSQMNSQCPCGENCRHAYIPSYVYVEEDCPDVFPRLPCIQM
ncbi:hypothetical protein MKX03_001566 [Papaver bracteatum]|nr:hypothetical protein MKX03_001566 [Papaver bracteatum]